MFNLNSMWVLFITMAMILVRISYAQTAACTAEANFQGCKTIQKTRLDTCPPADYACMCTAQKLIQECFNLCPIYAAESSAQDGIVKTICSAVPSSSSAVPLPTASSPSPSSVRPTASASPSQQVQQNNQQHSGATFVLPSFFILAGSLFLCLLFN